jgi:cellulose synthase/poly-beta-1,6-N-acetylglucosamine synthase-like glycosyltransferase
MISGLFDGFVVALAVTVALTAALQAGLVLAAVIDLRRSRTRNRFRHWRSVMSSPLAPTVTVLVPAFNESVTIQHSLAGILALTYQNLEVVVVDDGSTDGTEQVLVDAFDLVEVHKVYQATLPTEDVVRLYRSRADARLTVAHKKNGGKADALNTAINLASGSLICTVDADTLIDPDALQKLVSSFVDDPEVVAAGGTVRLTNGGLERGPNGLQPGFPRQLWAACQVVEYTRAFLVGRLGWNQLGGNLIVSGAFGVFRRHEVVLAGGYLHGSVGEDMELVVRLRRQGHETGRPAKVTFDADPVAWTEGPERLSELRRQRNRWYRGLLDVLVRHRSMLLRPKYRAAGMIALPYFVIVEALAPVIEALGLVIVVVGLLLGEVSRGQLLFIATAYGVGLMVSMTVLILDDLAFGMLSSTRTRVRVVLVAIFEHIIFRPMTVWWRLAGLVSFFQGKSDWGTQVRRGFGPTASPDRTLPQM